MAIGSNFYGEGDELNNLFRSQANQSINAGYNAADLADPFRNERKGYQNSLRSLMANPGEFSSSPVYKFAYDQGLNALQRKGSIRSGNKLAALMKYGQDAASQLYFPQANLLSTLSGATTGSPAAAGLAVSGAFNRAQDQRQMGAAAQMYGNGGGPNYRAAGTSQPWWWGSDAPSTGSALPTGGASGYGGAYNSTYSPSASYASPSSMSLAQLNAEAAMYGLPSMYPSSGGGSGYSSYGLDGYSDYGNWNGYSSALNGGGSFNSGYGYDPYENSALNGGGSFNDFSGA